MSASAASAFTVNPLDGRGIGIRCRGVTTRKYVEMRVPGSPGCCTARLPVHSVEFPDLRSGHDDALRRQERTLQPPASAVAAEAAAGRDHAMTGHVRPPALAHDVANGARRAWAACELGHIAVCRHAAHRNAAHDIQYALEKG